MLPADPAVIMKAGPHAGEDLNAIIARKQREAATAGWCLWGYGGSACHPLTQVQPHAEAAAPRSVTVLFIQTSSTPAVPSSAAGEYSADARTWAPVPAGHLGSGSKRTLVLRGRCDKACVLPASAPDPATIAQVVATAELVPPYSVLLRLAIEARGAGEPRAYAYRPSSTCRASASSLAR